MSNKTSTNNSLDLTCLKFIVFKSVDEIILPDCISPTFLLIFTMLGLFYFKVKFVRTDESCPHCGGKLHSKGYQPRSPNGMSNIYVKDYACSDCNKRVLASFDNFIDPHCMYTRSVQYWGTKFSEIGDESYRKLSELFEAIFCIKLPKSTLFNHKDKLVDDYTAYRESIVEDEVEKRKLKNSGEYHYDEQFPKQNGKNMTRMIMIDSVTMYPHKDYVDYEKEFGSDLIRKYFNITLKNIPRKIMITDGYRAYPSIIKEFGMQQQRCVFHIIYNAGNDIFPVINGITRKNKNKKEKLEKKNKELEKNKKEYKPKRGRISDKKQQKLHDNIKRIEKEIKKINNEINENDKQKEELLEYFEKLSNIFNTDNKSIAKERLTRLVNKIKFMPKCVVKAVKRIENNFEELTLYLIKRGIRKTNNMVELYFRTTLPHNLKRRYRTEKGLKRKLRTARIRWIHRNVLKNREPITNFFNEYRN